jgi:hypothetical protein
MRDEEKKSQPIGRAVSTEGSAKARPSPSEKERVTF